MKSQHKLSFFMASYLGNTNNGVLDIFSQVKIMPYIQAPKRDNGSDMDHMGEINTLKEKIISLEKQISSKNRELIAKDQVKLNSKLGVQI